LSDEREFLKMLILLFKPIYISIILEVLNGVHALLHVLVSSDVWHGPRFVVELPSVHDYSWFIAFFYQFFLHDGSYALSWFPGVTLCQSSYPVTMMFSAVDSYFWGIVYFLFACCHGPFSLTVGTILGMCVGPVAVFAGVLLNWLLGLYGGDQATCGGQYGYALVVFGVLMFVVNLAGNLSYRKAALCGSTDPDGFEPLLEA